MRIAAKGVLPDGYRQFGKFFPRNIQAEFDVTPEEFAAIMADEHIVAVAIPEITMSADFIPSKNKGK